MLLLATLCQAASLRIDLPPGEDVGVWASALGSAGFVAVEANADVVVTAVGERWRLSARDAAGQTRVTEVAAPRDPEARASVAWLAASLVRPGPSVGSRLAPVRVEAPTTPTAARAPKPPPPPGPTAPAAAPAATPPPSGASSAPAPPPADPVDPPAESPTPAAVVGVPPAPPDPVAEPRPPLLDLDTEAPQPAPPLRLHVAASVGTVIRGSLPVAPTAGIAAGVQYPPFTVSLAFEPALSVRPLDAADTATARVTRLLARADWRIDTQWSPVVSIEAGTHLWVIEGVGSVQRAFTPVLAARGGVAWQVLPWLAVEAGAGFGSDLALVEFRGGTSPSSWFILPHLSIVVAR